MTQFYKDIDSCNGVYQFLADIFASYSNDYKTTADALIGFNVCPGQAESGAEYGGGVYELSYTPKAGGPSVVFGDYFEIENIKTFNYDWFCHWLKSCVTVFKYSHIEY